MQAVILVGGKGTRLRPLTSERPKPIVPVVDRPFLAHMLEWVARHGMTDVVLCCGFRSDAVVEAIGDGSAWGVNVTWVFEPEPRGTAGAVKMAEEHLQERFMLINGDVLTDMDLSAQIAAHERTGAVATLALVPVEDPSAYGLVRLEDDGRVRGFLEKPKLEDIDTDLISAGAYVLERSVMDMIPAGREVSIEREVWPFLVGEGLHGHVHRGAYWMDIGTPERYVQGISDVLSGAVRTATLDRMASGGVMAGADVHPTAIVAADALVEGGARVGPGARIGSGAVVSRGGRIEAGASLHRAVLLPGVRVGARAHLDSCVVGAGATVGDAAHVTDHVIIGDGVRVPAGIHLPELTMDAPAGMHDAGARPARRGIAAD
ncbi:nucleotidyltransferase family protein [Patulibacter minatonensis]|uniref:nucleotidyltransferase family protein n=1 Tax=Patulibacter minatonensis TaxID=298163 RepID=UPI0004B6DD9A|nr:NDP-sugar synthase [Patulibacter minatonensis]